MELNGARYKQAEQQGAHFAPCGSDRSEPQKRKRRKQALPVGPLNCTLQDGKADLILLRPLQFCSGCLQVAVLPAVVSASPSMGRRSQSSRTIVNLSTKISPDRVQCLFCFYLNFCSVTVYAASLIKPEACDAPGAG